MRSLEARPELTTSTERLSAQVAAERTAGTALEKSPILVDVRTSRERQQKNIAGSIHLPLNHLVERRGELPGDRPVIVYCAGGYRSSIAASLLQQEGLPRVSEIAGGITAWESANLPIETGASPT
jgi:rhodanese-related sulfurtransferase